MAYVARVFSLACRLDTDRLGPYTLAWLANGGAHVGCSYPQMPRPAPIRVLAGWQNRYRADAVDSDVRRGASLASRSAQSVAASVSLQSYWVRAGALLPGRYTARRLTPRTNAGGRRGFRRSGLSGRRNEY